MLDLLDLLLLGDSDDEDPVLAEAALYLLLDGALGQGVAPGELLADHHLASLAPLLVPALHTELLPLHVHGELAGLVARGVQADQELLVPINNACPRVFTKSYSETVSM